MPLPDFRIEPWELPEVAPGTPVVASAAARLLVRGNPYLIRVVQENKGRDLLVVRPEREGAANCFIRELYDSVGQRFLKSLHSDPSLAAEKLQIFLGAEHRIIFLDEELRLLQDGDWAYRLAFSRRSGNWESEEMGIFSNWTLARDEFERLRELAASEVMQYVWQWTRERSDCAFAFDWVSHGWNWPSRKLLSFKLGTAEEIEMLMQWATWSDGALADSEVSWVLNAKSRRTGEVEREIGILKVDLHIDSREVPVPPEWKGIWKILQTYFDLRIDQKLIDQYPYTEWEAVGDEVSWWLTIPPASAHEQVEARLKWREWVQTHVPQSQWRTLLPNDEVVE